MGTRTGLVPDTSGGGRWAKPAPLVAADCKREDGWSLTAFNDADAAKGMTVYAICKG